MNFDFATLAFLGFAATAATAALATITARNPVHAALWLVLTFFSVACTWIVGGAEFLGIALVLVYVGAVMVLFLFVVMMLDIDVAALREGWVRFLPVGLVVPHTSADDTRQGGLTMAVTHILKQKGREVITVTPDGLYELNGQVFKSLSAAARHITGTQWNGPKFFGLRGGKGDGQ